MASLVSGTLSLFSSCNPWSEAAPKTSETTVYQGDSLALLAPDKTLAPGSLKLVSNNQTASFKDWSDAENAESYQLLQAISSIWHEKEKIDQYMVFGQEKGPLQEPFAWEAIPYQNQTWAICRFWQQFKVLLNITFGASSEPCQLHTHVVSLFQSEMPQEIRGWKDQASKIEGIAAGNDSFCKADVIEKQRVLEGKRVNVLYNYAPIGFGGERLHFLIVPKEHRKSFKELTPEEYSEAAKLTRQVLGHFKETRQAQNAYIFHKTGKDAGQTVDHWHMHLIITGNASQDMAGKFTVLKNMTIGSTPLKGEALKKEVDKYKKELADLSK